MLEHLAYFEVLSSIEHNSPSWAPTLAGLGVLTLVDTAREDSSMLTADWAGMRAVSESVTALHAGNPLRRPLARVVDYLMREPRSWSDVNSSLFAYGRALDLAGSWNLAADVFATVAGIARAEHDPELAIEATTALGGAARRSGDWDRSAEGYAEAAHLADALGDRASGLTVRVGTANTLLARGDLPAAQAILDEVVAEASRSNLAGVAALALHASASVAHLRGQYADAVSLAHRALDKTTNAAVKDTIMSDIAAAFFELGMHDAARDAYLVISMTSRYQWVRWQATINLMELASVDNMESAFESYASDLKNAALEPRLRSYFLLYYGQGCGRFGRDEEATRYVAAARDFAAANKIHQVVFDAEKELASAGRKRAQRAKQQTVWTEAIPSDVMRFAAQLTSLREAARSSPPDEGS